jgi:hypothetical protein
MSGKRLGTTGADQSLHVVHLAPKLRVRSVRSIRLEAFIVSFVSPRALISKSYRQKKLTGALTTPYACVRELQSTAMTTR